MHALVVVNPRATTTTARSRDVLLRAMTHDVKTDVVETDHRHHAVDLAREARRDGLDIVVVLGGDGTVNEVVNGLLSEGPGDDVPSLGIVPGGSTNVLARDLGIAQEPVEATGQFLDAVREGRRRTIGLGRADTRWFTFTAGLGFDADVIRRVEERRGDGARASLPLYARSMARQYARGYRRHGPITVEVAGADPVGGAFLVIVANTSPWTYLGSREVLPLPQASFETGLDLLALRRFGPLSAARHSVQLLAQRREGPRGRDIVTFHDVAHAVLRSRRPLPFQLDGDYVGERERVVLTAVPEALQVVV